MKKLFVSCFVMVAVFSSCATANKRMSSAQQAAGAVIITGAAVGGAVWGAEMAEGDSAAGVATLTAIGCAGLSGIIYDALLNLLNVKETVPESAAEEGKDIPDFMLPAN